MSNFAKPVFSAMEMAQIEAGCLDFGYKIGLRSGYDFSSKPFGGKLAKGFIKAKEKLDGTAAKRECHAKINSFGWARFHRNLLIFGLKYSVHGEVYLSKTGKKAVESAIAKYKQLLGYLLQQAGWKNIEVDNNGDYVVLLDNAENVKLLYTLSPSIGFYYKVSRPTLEDLRRLEAEVAYNAQKLRQEKTR